VDVSTGPLASFDKPEGYLERQVNRFAALWEVAVLRTSPEVAELAGRHETKPPHDPGRIVVRGDPRLGRAGPGSWPSRWSSRHVSSGRGWTSPLWKPRVGAPNWSARWNPRRCAAGVAKGFSTLSIAVGVLLSTSSSVTERLGIDAVAVGERAGDPGPVRRPAPSVGGDRLGRVDPTAPS
jgi:hypothetical protein